MTLNEWWRDDPAERYWMEITDRIDLGADLHAPQLDDAGRDYWSYSLVTAVQPGDIVLHWHKSLLGSPGIVAYSVADHGPFEDKIRWASQGTYGRARQNMRLEPSWKYALTSFAPLPQPIGQDVFRLREPVLRRVRNELEATHSGPLYFPFAFSDKRPVRAAQGYLVKFPAEIIRTVPELHWLASSSETWQEYAQRVPASEAAAAARRNNGGGYLTDTRVRLALERHAVNWAMDYYGRQGYHVDDVGAFESYDIKAVAGSTELHIEVKGSSGDAESVELTHNEVQHARGTATHLVVVDQIKWRRLPDGSIETSDGRVRRWESWSPADKSLTPTRYRYQLDGGMRAQGVGYYTIT